MKSLSQRVSVVSPQVKACIGILYWYIACNRVLSFTIFRDKHWTIMLFIDILSSYEHKLYLPYVTVKRLYSSKCPVRGKYQIIDIVSEYKKFYKENVSAMATRKLTAPTIKVPYRISRNERRLHTFIWIFSNTVCPRGCLARGGPGPALPFCPGLHRTGASVQVYRLL